MNLAENQDKICWTKRKTFSYLIDDLVKIKNANGAKSVL